jgi:hypothetical protein
LELQEVHIVGEEQAEQFVGQSKHVPLDKYLPILQVEQVWLVDYEHVKQIAVVKQHSMPEI